jgi:hypothetical protein
MNRILVPGFLKHYDNYLLKNKPDVWSTRVHLVVYYSLLTTLVLTGLYWLAANNPLSEKFEKTWLPYMAVVSIIGIIVYLVYLLRFNVFKRYGKLNMQVHAAKNYVYYFISIIAMLLPCFVPMITDYIAAKSKYTAKQLAADTNTLNLHYELATDGLEKDWDMKSALVINDSNDSRLTMYLDTFRMREAQENMSSGSMVTYALNEQDNSRFYQRYLSQDDSPSHFMKTWQPIITEPYDEDAKRVSFEGNERTYDYYIYSGVLDSVVATRDSVIYSKNNTVFFFSPPQLGEIGSFFSYARNESNTIDTTWRTVELWRKMLAYPTSTTKAQHADKFCALADKYLLPVDKKDLKQRIYHTEVVDDKVYGQSMDSLRSIAYRVDNNMENVLDKLNTFRWKALEPFLIMFTLMALISTILLMIYRHTTIRAFWLSVLAGFLITIFTGLAMVSTNGSEETLKGTYVLYLIVSILLSSLALNSIRTRSTGIGIALNLCVVLCTMLPSFILINLHEHYRDVVRQFEMGTYHGHRVNVLRLAEYESKLNFIEAMWPWMPLITAAFMLVLMVVAFVPAYKKWYSLPEN